MKTHRETRRDLIAKTLPEVRSLVKKYDLGSVNSAVKVIYEERKAEKALKDAEAKVQALKNKLGK